MFRESIWFFLFIRSSFCLFDFILIVDYLRLCYDYLVLYNLLKLIKLIIIFGLDCFFLIFIINNIKYRSINLFMKFI